MRVTHKVNMSAPVLLLGGKRVTVEEDALICPDMYTRRNRRSVWGDLQVSLKSLFGDIRDTNAV